MNPTGVGKHQNRMLAGLSRRDGIALHLLVPAKDLTPAAMDTMQREWGTLQVSKMNWSACGLERMWRLFDRPMLPSECSEAEWIYSPFEALPPARSAKRAATIHQVMWFDPEVEWYGDWLRMRMAQRRLYNQIARDADLVICVSRYLEERFIELFPAAKGRTAVVYNGVDDVFFDAAERRSEAAQPTIIVIGAIVPRKGAEMLFAVADMLSESVPEARIRVVSGADSPPAMLAQARIRKNIELLEYRHSDDVAEMMSSATILLQLSPTETFGMPAAEAMACGLPVVAVNAMAAVEVTGGAAAMVPYGDAELAAEKIRATISDLQLRSQMAASGRDRAEVFRWSKCVDSLIGALEGKVQHG